MQIINIHETKTHLSKLLAQVQEGKEIIIGKAGVPMAKLIPYVPKSQPKKRSSIFDMGGALKGLKPKKPIDITNIRDYIDYTNW